MRPRARFGRPTPHPLRLPRPLKTQIPPTVLSRRRALDGLDLGIGELIAETLRAAVKRITDRLRDTLEKVANGLRRVGRSTEGL